MNIQPLLTEEDMLLLRRTEELYSRADNGIPAMSSFLSPREQFIIEKRLGACFTDDEASPLCFFAGGYPSAERRILCCLPSYMRYTVSEPNDFDELSEYILPLRIASSGYVKLSHRDYLGSMIGLGIERTAIGDILPDDKGAIIFVSPTVAGLLKNELSHIGRDTVHVTDTTLPDGFDYERAFEHMSGTVASARLDGVLSELARTSREKAKNLILGGFCEHNHFTASRPDAEVTAGDIISVRKTSDCKGGKFIVDAIGELSNKGRVRLSARKYL